MGQNIFTSLPAFLRNLLPAEVRQFGDLAWMGVLAILAIGLLGLIYSFVFGGRRPSGSRASRSELEEDLSEYPPLKPSTGDRRLLIEGVPVRLRLVVLAPTGGVADVENDEVAGILDQVLPGLGQIYEHDNPRLRVWPRQMSYEGFGRHFHRNTLSPDPPGQLSVWSAVAGRVRVGNRQYMLGLALQSVKPNTVGRRTIDAHEWASILRVRVRGGE